MTHVFNIIFCIYDFFSTVFTVFEKHMFSCAADSNTHMHTVTCFNGKQVRHYCRMCMPTMCRNDPTGPVQVCHMIFVVTVLFNNIYFFVQFFYHNGYRLHILLTLRVSCITQFTTTISLLHNLVCGMTVEWFLLTRIQCSLQTVVAL